MVIGMSRRDGRRKNKRIGEGFYGRKQNGNDPGQPSGDFHGAAADAVTSD